MNIIPCEECISFAICNVQIKQKYPKDVTQFSLIKNCEMLQDYIGIHRLKIGEHSILNRKEIANARKLFGLEPVFPKDKYQMKI